MFMKVRVHHFLIDLDSKPKELRKTVRWRYQQREPVTFTAPDNSLEKLYLSNYLN